MLTAITVAELIIDPTGKTVLDSNDLVRGKAKDKGVLCLPGVVFMPDGSATPCVRTSFSMVTEEDADEAFRRLREVVLEARAELVAK